MSRYRWVARPSDIAKEPFPYQLVSLGRALLDLDVQWLGENFISHEVDLFRIKVVDLPIQNCLLRSVQQPTQTLADGRQPEIVDTSV
jgi:hypothetical protein